jgi:chromosome segregation ATPase
MTRIDVLRNELAQANDHVDDKLEQLESAGIDIIALTKQLETQKDRNVELQQEISRLSRREDRIVKRLERCKCEKCGKRFDASPAARRALTDNSK